jgi:uncharacterized protein YkwD
VEVERPARRPLRRQGNSGFRAIALVLGMVLLGSAAAIGYSLFSPLLRDRQPAEARIASAETEKAPVGESRKTRRKVKEEEIEQPPPETPADPIEKPAVSEEEALTRRVLSAINAQRRLVGRDEVVLHAAHSSGCLAHATYLAKNAATENLDPHEEDPHLPGVTDAGRQTAPSASVAWREPVAAINGWLATPGHRALLLDASLKSVGFGFTRTATGEWVSVFDLLRGAKGTPGTGAARAVLYPAHRQQEVPLEFPGSEVPDPLPNAKNEPAGYPITATFPPSTKVPTAEAWLENEAGEEVAAWLSSPARPANERFTRSQRGTVCLFSRKLLEPGTRYVVYVQATAAGEDWSRVWSFTTVGPAEVRRRRYERAVARLNDFRRAAGLDPVDLDEKRSKACLAHADYLARNLDRAPGLRPEEELPDLPGYTREGSEIARASAPRIGGRAGPVDAIDWMMASILNRHLVLNPTAKTAALGAALHAPRGWIWVLSLPPLRREGDGPQAILYPGPGQKDVPLFFGREIGSLVPGESKGTVAGFAVTAGFFPKYSLTSVTATLKDESGKEVNCWLSTPQNPLKNVGSYRQILLVPKKALAPATKYTATFAAVVQGKKWQQRWSFTTMDPARYQEEVAGVLLESVNRARKLAGLGKVSLDASLTPGCAKHARYVVRNIDHPKVVGIGIHDEDPSLPGATPEGAKAGKAAVIAVISDPAESVDGWMATLYHRLSLLDPRLTRVGYGQAQHPLRGWVTVLDTGTGR